MNMIFVTYPWKKIGIHLHFNFCSQLVITVPVGGRSTSDWHLAVTATSGVKDWHCPLAFKQHQYLNPCQQHLEIPSGLPSK